jgi:MFS family permease
LIGFTVLNPTAAGDTACRPARNIQPVALRPSLGAQSAPRRHRIARQADVVGDATQRIHSCSPRAPLQPEPSAGPCSRNHRNIVRPTVGSWITHNHSWHWLVSINLLPGIFVAVVVPIMVKIDKPGPYGLDRGPWAAWNTRWRKDRIGIGPITKRSDRPAWIPGVAGSAFIWHSLTFARPVVDLRALKSPTFALGCFFFMTGVGIFATIGLTPLYWNGLSALQIGLAVFSAGIFHIMVIPVYTFLALMSRPGIATIMPPLMRKLARACPDTTKESKPL